MIKSSLFKKLQGILVEQGMMLCCAESCTGGLFASQCVNISGASKWFNGGVVVYANTLKESLLGVSGRVISEHGAVSQACAKSMAEGGLTACGSDVCVSVTGVAGPSGGTDAKPVGTVFIAVAIKNQNTQVFELHLEGTRDEIRAQSVNAMAEHLIYCLSSL